MKKELEKHIRKLSNPLKAQEEIKSILKARLTKREYKLLQAWSDEAKKNESLESLKMSSEDYDKLSKKLIKKLNQEKLKHELCG